MPFWIELDFGLGHFDRRQSEVLAGDEIQLFVDVVDLLAQFLELGRGLVTKPREMFGVDLFFDRFRRGGIPLRLGIGYSLTERRVDVGLEGLP